MPDQNPLIKPAKKELANLKRRLAKARAEYDEYQNIHHEYIAINEELAAIVQSKKYGKETIAKLEGLQKRRDKANQVRKKNFVKLMDKTIELQIEIDQLSSELSRLEWRDGLRKRAAN